MPARHTAISKPHRSKQRGAALMVMLVIVVMGSLAFLVSSLSKPVSQIERDKKTVEALAQAKEALIAYAVSNDVRPGNLPCPDRDAPSDIGYGDAEGSCSAFFGTSIGRLPWKTLGIPELVDASGEPLWYAISNNFRIVSSRINSDTQGSLLVYDNIGTTLLTPSGSEAAAIVFSPGTIVVSQQRSSSAEKKVASNYLDIGPNSRNNATAGGPFISANKTDTFNDRLIFVTADQLLLHIEKRAAGEIKNLLKTYYTSWVAYPFAATFSNPSTSSFIGTTGTYYGLPPLGGLNGIGNYTYPTWNATPSISFSGGGSTSGCELRDGNDLDGNFAANSRWRCNDISVLAGSTITITGTLNNVGKGFWKLHEISDTEQVRARNSFGNTVLTTSVLDNVSVTGSLNSSGRATVTFRGTGRAGIPSIQRIELRDILTYQSLLPNWFQVNDWHQVMYYATSPGYAPGGGNACNPLPGTPSCLTVNGQGGGNNKRALVVMPGKALASQAAHFTGTLSNYLEAENPTPANFIYENESRSSTFNDQVIIVAP